MTEHLKILMFFNTAITWWGIVRFLIQQMIFTLVMKEASFFSTVPSVVYTFVFSHMDGHFRGLKNGATELSR